MMRQLLVLAVVVLLGVTPLTEGRHSAVAQEASQFEIIITESIPWEQVSQPRIVPQDQPVGGAGTSPIEDLQQYEVYFGEERAAVPVVQNAEFMLVVVQAGYFALDLKPQNVAPEDHSPPGTFLVHPSGNAPIPIMQFLTPDPPGPHYGLTGGFVQDASGNCTSMCLISTDEVVQAKPGDHIVAREGAICIWCLQNQGTPDEDLGKGLLLVTPVEVLGAEADFSWLVSWNEVAARSGIETETVWLNTSDTGSMRGESARMAWAYNPGGTRCGGG